MTDNIQQLKFFKSSSLEKAKQEFNSLFAEKNSRLAVIAILIINFLTVLASLILYSQMPPELPLYYVRPWGEEQLVNKQVFLTIIFASIVIIIINIRMAGFFLKKNKVLSQIIIWTNLLFVLLISINIFKIFSLVIF